jgi:methylmalonyl-CoA/ethylmalonyl-CoA epimerase
MSSTGLAADLATAPIAQIAIRAHDVARATAFYRDRLGIRFLFEFPGLAFFQSGDTRLMLTRPEQPEHDHPGSVLYFRVPDVEATHRTLAERGVRFEGPPHVVHRAPTYELWMAFFRDSEDNLLALMTEKPV